MMGTPSIGLAFGDRATWSLPAQTSSGRTSWARTTPSCLQSWLRGMYLSPTLGMGVCLSPARKACWCQRSRRRGCALRGCASRHRKRRRRAREADGARAPGEAQIILHRALRYWTRQVLRPRNFDMRLKEYLHENGNATKLSYMREQK